MEVDLENGKVKVRDDLVYEFKELVTRKDLQVIKDLRKKHSELEEKGVESISQDDMEKLEDEWYNTVLPLGLKDFKKNDIDTIPTDIINFFPYTHTLIEGILKKYQFNRPK